VNSIEDLNNYSSTSITYNDDRDYAIAFTPNVAVNQSISVTEDIPFLAPEGINITTANSVPSPISYNINVANTPGTTVTWTAPLPTGVSTTTSGNVYTATGISSVSHWDTIKNPIITLPADTTGNVSYTSNIVYPLYANNSVHSWQTNVAVAATPELSIPSTFSYNEDTPFTLSNYATIVDTSGATSYTYTITPSTTSAIKTATLGGSGGTASFNSTTKVITFTGTKTEINGRLPYITITPGTDFDTGYTLTYQLVNGLSGTVSSVAQTVTSGLLDEEIVNINYARYYNEHGYNLTYPTQGIRPFFLSNTPYIGEDVAGASYDVTIELSSNVGVLVASTGDTIQSNSNWDQANLTFSYSGSRTTINSMFSQVMFLPWQGQTGDFTMTYTQSRDGEQQLSETFNVFGDPLSLNMTNYSYFDWSNQDTVWNEDLVATAGNDTGAGQVRLRVFPPWDNNFSIVVKTRRGSVDVDDVGYFTSYGSWTTIGTSSDQYGIYKNFNQETTVSAFNNYFSSVLYREIFLQLRADYAQDFQVQVQMCIGGTYNGTAFSGGTVYTNDLDVTVNPHDDYSVISSANYSEDTSVDLQAVITDDDTSSIIPWNEIPYAITVKQLSPNIAAYPGAFAVNTSWGSWGSNLATTAYRTGPTTTDDTLLTIRYQPPNDYTGTITLEYAQSKTVNEGNGNIVVDQGSTIITLTNTQVHDEYTAPTNYNVTVYGGNVSLSGIQITDLVGDGYTPGTNYYANLALSSNIANISVTGSGVTYTGGNVSIYGTKNVVNSRLSTAVITAYNTETTANLELTITRTSDGTVLADDDITVNVVEPTVGSEWQGGIYFGKINSSTGKNTRTDPGSGYDYYLVESTDWPSDGGLPWTPYHNLHPTLTMYFPDTPVVAPPSANDELHDGYTNSTTIGTTGDYLPVDYCLGLTRAGYSDWYLPSQTELAMLASFGDGSQTLGYGLDLGNPPNFYWSSTISTRKNTGSGDGQSYPPGYTGASDVVDYFSANITMVAIDGHYRRRTDNTLLQKYWEPYWYNFTGNVTQNISDLPTSYTNETNQGSVGATIPIRRVAIN